MKKRVTLIFLTLLFTILAFGKVDLYAETTDEGTNLEESALSDSASETEETKEEPEEAPQEEIEEEVKETVEEVKETEQAEDTKETVEEERPQVEDKFEDKTKEKSVEESEDQQTVSDAKEDTVDPEEGKEEEIKDEESEEKPKEETEVETEGEEKTESEGEKTENEGEETPEDSEEAKEAEKTDEKAEGETVLEEGEVLEVSELAENPLALGQGQGGKVVVKEVTTFDELKSAIDDAEEGKTTKIIIKNEIIITGTLIIKANTDIILTSEDEKSMDDRWKPIEQPKDFAKEGEEKQREKIEEARKRGQDAIDAANNITKEDEDYYYNFNGQITIKRANNFNDTLFSVLGKLTLGDKKNSINFDGNKKHVVSNQGSKGSFFDVKSGGKLTLNNGTIANGKSENDYSASIKLHAGSEFNMNGGRITANTNRLNSGFPYTAGAVYIEPSAKFTMNNGMIDHNIGAAGAVFMGRGGSTTNPILKNDDDFALFKLNGGNIVSNEAKGGFGFAGGIFIFPQGKLNLKDGIIAGNKGQNRGGAITITDQYVTEYTNGSMGPYSKSTTTHNLPYEKFILRNRAEANFNGGLIFKNSTPDDGGGVFVDTNTAYFNRVMILDNEARTLGGGIYISYPPRTQTIKEMLITENSAEKYTALNPGENGAPGSGGGIWSCPYGYIHIGDGHTVYVFNNTAANKGADFAFRQKTNPFELTYGSKTERIDDRFYVYLSPITKDHNFIKFLNDDGTGNLIPENMSYFKEKAFLKTVYNEALKAEAWRNSGAFILGNKAGYGAGLGTNANLETPKDEGDIEFHFKKKWDEKIDKSEYENKDIHIDIFIVPLDKDEVYVRSQYGYDKNLFKYGEVILNQGNNWQASFTKNAFSNYATIKDRGLPFTKEKLKEMGYKYLVMERETDYANSVEEKNAEAPVQPGTVLITRDRSKKYGGKYDNGYHNADFYFYELNKDGTLSYIGKSKKNGNSGINAEFSHDILSAEIKAVIPYGNNRSLIEKGRAWQFYKGYGEALDKYSIFVEKTNDGIILHVPYIWTEVWDGGLSRIKVAKKEPVLVEEKDFYGYEFVISNRPFTEAKIKKTWKMLNGEEITDNSHELKNRNIPDQVTFYILKDGKRIPVDYKRDKNGKVYPIYKTVTITKSGGWKGTITRLDPLHLEKGAYGIEEEALDGFEMSYKLNKVLVDPRENRDEDEDKVNIKFRLSREYAFLSSIGSWIKKQPGYIPQDSNGIINEEPFRKLMGNITVRLIVDGNIKEQKTMTWNGSSLDDDDLLFGYNEEKPIIVDAGGHNIRVRYYNSMDEKWGYHDVGYQSVNLFLKKDNQGVYTLYVPNVLVNGNFAKVFKVTEKDLSGEGRFSYYPEIKDLNPDADNLDPYYEYTFEVTNTELPPPPEEPKTYVTVSKLWEALGETQAIRVQLYVNGEATNKFLTLSEANGWTATFYDLDEYDFMGNRYTYTVREVGDENGLYKIGDREFEVSYAGNMDKGFTITNKEIPPEEPEEPEPEEPEEPDEPEDEGGGENIIPKTGVKTDAKSIYLSLILLIALVVLKRKKYSK